MSLLNSTSPSPSAEKLEVASFRGVKFGVLSASDAVGRSVVTHIFPQRDAPFVEDMAQATRIIKVTGFVLGSDWRQKRDDLQRVLDEAGPGTLVHPWYGSLHVALRTASIAHSADALGYCAFEAEFVRVEKPDAPGSSLNARAVTSLRANRAGLLAAAALQTRMVLSGVTQYVLDATHGVLTGMVADISATLGVDVEGLAAWVSPVLADATLLYELHQRGELGTAMLELFTGIALSLPVKHSSSLGGMGSGRDPQPLYHFSASAPHIEIPWPAGISRTLAAQNRAALYDAQRTFSAIEALRLTAEYTPATRAEAMTVRGLAVETVDAVQLRAADDEYAACSALRASALAALSEAAGRAPDVVMVTEVQSRPSLAVLHRWTGDIAAERDFLARNRVRHPGFVSGGQSLEVLRG